MFGAEFRSEGIEKANVWSWVRAYVEGAGWVGMIDSRQINCLAHMGPDVKEVQGELLLVQLLIAVLKVQTEVIMDKLGQRLRTLQ